MIPEHHKHGLKKQGEGGRVSGPVVPVSQLVYNKLSEFISLWAAVTGSSPWSPAAPPSLQLQCWGGDVDFAPWGGQDAGEGPQMEMHVDPKIKVLCLRLLQTLLLFPVSRLFLSSLLLF